MKNIILLFCLLSSIACTENSKYEKPFIIISKQKSVIEEWGMYYIYQDQNGKTHDFYDIEKYDIGDTLK